MKAIMIAIFLFPLVCFADTILIIDKGTKEVYSISNNDDTILPEGKEKIILEGSLSDYEFKESPTNYKYKNGKFLKNLEKIEKEELKKERYQEIVEEKEMIDNQIRALAIAELKKMNKKIKHFNNEGVLIKEE